MLLIAILLAVAVPAGAAGSRPETAPASRPVVVPTSGPALVSRPASGPAPQVPATAPASAATAPARAVSSAPVQATQPVQAPVAATQSAPATQPASAPTTRAVPLTRPAPPTRPASAPATRKVFDKPDIVLLTAGHLPLGLTGFGGNPTVKTPHLERLAADGVLFTRCYAVAPQLAMSRASLLTGQYPHTHGVTSESGAIRSPTETWPARLARAGYTCSFVGSWGLASGVPPELRPFGFNGEVVVTGQPQAGQNGNVWIADRAIELLSRPGDGPLFLWVSFDAPGEPTVYPPGAESLYPPAGVDLPAALRGPIADRPPAVAQCPAAHRFQQMAEPAIRLARSKYYATLAHLDGQIGRILQGLDEAGLRQTSIVVFTSDTGFALGEHQLFSVGPAFYDALVRCPLIVRQPEPAPPGQRVDRVVSLIDLAPALLEIAGLRVPMDMQGVSLRPLLAGAASRRRADEAFLEWERGEGFNGQIRGIVAGHYKYVRYSTGTDVLYDLKRDPGETRSVLGDFQYRAVADVLKNRLQHWQRTTRDPLYRKTPF